MERISRWLWRNWKLVAGLLAGVFVIACLCYIPIWQADDFRSLVSLPREESLKADKLTAKEYFEIENEARKTLAQIFGGLFVLIGIYLAFKRQTVAEETLRVAERGQITDRFTKAIEQLGKEQLELRLGAIYALEKIAHDSADYHWQVMEVLTAYVRNKYHWKKGAEPTRSEDVPLDLEAIMTVLRRRKHERETEGQTINLSETDLRKVNLIDAYLHKARFNNANLQEARFNKANLQGARFNKANLQGAWFSEANLQEARFRGANLQRAGFEKANLQGAWFSEANLQGAWFSEANLRGAGFSEANLQDAWFEKAILQEVQLIEADLRGAKNLTQEQIDSTRCSQTTSLPEGLNNSKAFENLRTYLASLQQPK